MKVIPAIDIRRGRVVRLAQGSADKETVYPDSPIETAGRWDGFGVEVIHIIDLDGAFAGKPKNLDIIKDIAASVKAKVELGGGIRDEATIRLVLDSGIDKVVIGTKALDAKFLSKVARADYRERVIAGIDAKDGVVYTKGWLNKTRMPALDLVKEIADFGITTINYTDISKDGMLEGPNIGELKTLLSSTGLNVVVSGGVSSIEDVKRLKALEKNGLKGMIIGKALYEGRIDLAEAIRICSQKE